MTDRPRNVVVRLELELHVPGAEGESLGPLGDFLDDDAEQRVVNLVHDLIEGADPEDTLNVVVSVEDVRVAADVT